MNFISYWASASALIVYVVYLLLPGYVILRVGGYRRHKYLLSFAISFSFLILTQIPFMVLGGTVASWYVALHLCYLLAVGGVWFLGRQKRMEVGFDLSNPSSPQLYFWGWVTVLIIYTAYHIWVGPYTEIPSDFWAHMGHVKNEVRIVSDGNFIPLGSLSRAVGEGAYVPFIHAAVAWNLGVLPIWLVPVATLANSAIFLLAVFWFSIRICAGLKLSRALTLATGLLTSLFTVLAFGVSTFAYIRYYAYMPHMLNFVLLFGVMSLFMDYLEEEDTGLPHFIATIALWIVMVFTNYQEALFVLVLMGALTIVKSLRSFRSDGTYSGKLGQRARVLAILVVFGIPILIGYAFLKLPMGKLGVPHVIDLNQVIPFFRSLPIANPWLRFWDTLAIFGVVVYCWYYFRFEWFVRSDYLTIAMLSPLFTLFNPLFVWWFLHVSNWDPLWRLAYLMPLPFVGAALITMSVNRAVSQKSRLGLITITFMVIILVGSLAPINWRYIYNDNPRWSSLASVEHKNGALLWGDLIDVVGNLKGEEVPIFTDYVTNYVLSTATPHGITSGAKSRWQTRQNAFYGDYKDRLLYWRHDGDFLIINHRDGEFSETGRLSGHWWDNILKVKRLYPVGLREFVDSHPEDFELLWSADKIWVYKLLINPEHYK